jgi:outer membrane protein TolC
MSATQTPEASESKFIRRLAVLSSACVSVVLVGGCVSEPPPFQPRDLQSSERIHSREVETREKRPLPTTLESPFLDIRPDAPNPTSQISKATTGPSMENERILRLPLQEVIHRAVANSLDIRVAGYTPAIDETRVTEAEARFDPVFYNNVQFQRTDRDGGLFSSGNAKSVQNQVGVKQVMPSGGQVQLQQSTNWTDPNPTNTNSIVGSSRTNRHPFWENELSLQLTQPLLRDFGNEINRARITINRNNQRVSLLEFRKQVEQTISDIETTYWDLVTAERQVLINTRLLDETIDMGDVLWKRRGQDVTTVQLSQANASIESRRATLIRAKARVLDLSEALKRLMNDPEMPVASNIVVLPANAPSKTPIAFDLADQINTAMENRFELGEQQLKIDNADIARKVAKNNLLPQLNLVGTYAVQGLDNDFSTSAKEESWTRNLNWSVGFQLEIPLGNREARAIYQRSLLQRLQAIDQYALLVSQISSDVTKALREVSTTWDEMAATTQATFAQQDALRAIERRQEGGEALTPTFVQLKLDTQERLAQAALSEAEAISNYNKAIKDLERAKGTLLRYDNVVMEEDRLPPGPH